MPDYPDFTEYAYIDIIAQSLGRVLTRPTYGGAQVSTILKAANPGVDTELIAMAGEGMLYGGYIAVYANKTIATSSFVSVIDGNIQSPVLFEVLKNFSMGDTHGTAIGVTHWDEITFRYGFILPYGITFEESAVFSYREDEGDTPAVLIDISYALT